MNKISTYRILNMYDRYKDSGTYIEILQKIESDIRKIYDIEEDSIMDYLDEIISNDLSARESLMETSLSLMEGYIHTDWETEEVCPFCVICDEDKHNQIIRRYRKTELGGYSDVVMFKPFFPCKEGHLLFVPGLHISGVTGSITTARIVSDVMMAIGKYIDENEMSGNIIINNGEDADQTIFHLHVHFIPRSGKDDGTKMPWK